MTTTYGALVCSICTEIVDQPCKNSIFLCEHCGGVAHSVPKTITIVNDEDTHEPRLIDCTTEHIVYNAR